MRTARFSVVAVAGRRIDSPWTRPPRFPLGNVSSVRRKMAHLFNSESVVALVASAACGTDLIALEEAERLNIRRRIILPFRADEFRNTSVTDRGDVWGPVFDRLIAIATRQNDLVVLHYHSNEDNNERAYRATNKMIIHEAKAL